MSLVARCSLQCMYGGCTVSFLVDRARVCFTISNQNDTKHSFVLLLMFWNGFWFVDFSFCELFVSWSNCNNSFVFLLCWFVARWSLFMLNIAKGKTLSSGKSIHSHFFSHDKGLFIATKITFKNRIGQNEETIHN